MEPLEILKQLYKEKFDIDEALVDLMADRDILHLTASGSSSISISRFLNIDLDEVKKVNKDFYGFNGWDIDLDLNPFSIFSTLAKIKVYDYITFQQEILLLSPYFKEGEVEKLYEVCIKFYTIEKLLEEEWI